MVRPTPISRPWAAAPSPMLSLDMAAQPDETTCGPTCLHALYRYYGERLELDTVIRRSRRLDDGGSLDVFLALDALEQGYACTLYPYNMALFDPTWFGQPGTDIADRLRRQARYKRDPRLQLATSGYLDYLEAGGRLLYRDLTSSLIRSILRRGTPIITGLSANYLYRSPRENPITCRDDPDHGEPCGHFVVIYGYDDSGRHVQVADPYRANPLDPGQCYGVGVERLIGAILLGALTFDANLLIIEPRAGLEQREPLPGTPD